jgi:dTDP-4-amino-4,6-dideoxygalactose transaminase
VEDAAQGIMAGYKGRALGAIGDLGTFSFRETKNIISGEGGSLLVSHPDLVPRAEIIREKGTDRGRFFRGEVDKYTWQDVGSSFLPGESTAAFLWAQLQQAQQITDARIASWRRYHEMLAPLESQGLLRRPTVPADCQHNGHLYYVILGPEIDRQKILDVLKENKIHAVSLRAIAFIPGRPALRAHAWRSVADDVVVAASDPTADVDGLKRSSAAAGVRSPGRGPQK